MGMDIPAKGEKISGKALTATSSAYDGRVARYQFLRDSLTGGGGYEDYLGAYDAASGEPLQDNPMLTYLQRYPRESDKRWTRRRRSTHYTRYLRWVAGVAVGLITRETPQRQDYPPEVAEWLGAAKFNRQISRLLPWCLAYDWVPVVVDMPRLSEQPSSRASTPASQRPYLRLVHPDLVLDHEWADDGLVWLKYSEPYSRLLDPMGARESGQRYWVLTRDGWWNVEIADGDTVGDLVTVTDSDAWPEAIRGRRVPVAIFSMGEDGSDPLASTQSWLEAPARVMRRLYNLQSQIASTEDSSCFPIYQFPVHSPTDIQTMKVGESTVLPFYSDSSHAPGWATYDVGPLKLLYEKEQSLVRQLKEIMSLLFNESDASTGVAKSYAFMELNVTLVDVVSGVERLELDICDCVARWLGSRDGMPEQAVPGWPRKFDLVDVQADIDAGSALLALDPGPAATSAIKKKLVLGRFLQDLPAADLKKIEREIEEEAEQAGVDERLSDEPEPNEVAAPEPGEVPPQLAPQPPGLRAKDVEPR